MENKFNQVRKCIFTKDRNTNDTVGKVEVGYKVIIKRILNLIELDYPSSSSLGYRLV